jgi:large subunit ribosomal protein L35
MEFAMPKMKTKSGAAKRFRVRGNGTLKRSSAYMRHILTKKSTKRKRQLRGMSDVHAGDVGHVRDMMPYA